MNTRYIGLRTQRTCVIVSTDRSVLPPRLCRLKHDVRNSDIRYLTQACNECAATQNEPNNRLSARHTL